MSATAAASPRRIAGPPLIALALGSLIALAAAWPTGHTPPDRSVAARTLDAATAPDGTLVLRDPAAAPGAAVVARYPGNVDSFVRGVFHALALRRAARALPPAAPYRLVRFASGRLVLLDPSTGSTVELAAFGTTNAASFSALLPRGQHPNGVAP